MKSFASRWTPFAVLLLATSAGTAQELNPVARTDGKPADLSKPVKVFVLMGQSNMVGMGKTLGDKEGTLENAVKQKKLYPFLVDDSGNWIERKDVRNVRVMVGKGGGMSVFNNEWMTIGKSTIGPEIGIGHPVGNALSEPVMILKSCIGNRSLGWDLLPPGSKGFEFEEKDKKTGQTKTYVYAGYKESPMKWEKGTTPTPTNGWYAGKQWDDDVANAKKVLGELDKYYPGAKGYEVAGFAWWQGEKDCGDAGLASRYEHNLVNLIEALRKEFNAPKAPFVMATLGEAKKGDKGTPTATVFDAMMNVDGDSGKYPQFKGNVATVYSNPLSKGGSGNGHYGGNAETYMNVGMAMGEAMVRLLGTSK